MRQPNKVFREPYQSEEILDETDWISTEKKKPEPSQTVEKYLRSATIETEVI